MTHKFLYSEESTISVANNLLSEFNKITLIEDLKKAYIEDKDQLIDDIETITVWEKVENCFTVKDFCDTIGLIICLDALPINNSEEEKEAMLIQFTKKFIDLWEISDETVLTELTKVWQKFCEQNDLPQIDADEMLLSLLEN